MCTGDAGNGLYAPPAVVSSSTNAEPAGAITAVATGFNPARGVSVINTEASTDPANIHFHGAFVASSFCVKYVDFRGNAFTSHLIAGECSTSGSNAYAEGTGAAARFDIMRQVQLANPNSATNSGMPKLFVADKGADCYRHVDMIWSTAQRGDITAMTGKTGITAGRCD